MVENLLSTKPHLKILLGSGYFGDHNNVEWSDVKDSGFRLLQKPYSLSIVLQSIKEIVKGI